MGSDPARFVAEEASRNGGICSFHILGRRFVGISTGEYARHVLVTRADRYRRSYHYENPVIGDGLLSTDGDYWQKRRRQASPAFRTPLLERIVPMVREETERLFLRWDEHAAAGEPVSIVREMQGLALSVSGHALFSRSIDPERSALFAAELRDSLRLLRIRNTSLLRLPIGVPLPLHRRVLRSRDTLDDFVRPIIAERRGAPLAETDLLDAVLAMRDPETGDALSDSEALDETKTLFAAGFETAATALAWTLHLVGRHPEVGTRWREELDRELGGAHPAWGDLPRLRYTSNLINESMRVYPPVYTIARECVVEDTIGGYRIPVGDVVMISILGVHHDPLAWPAPAEFRPERFSGDWPRKSFLPFGMGQHLCIGNNVALTELSVALAMIAQRFDFEPCDVEPVEALPQVTLVPGREIRFHLRRRP